MRKIISLMHISLDGFAAGPNGEMDWIVLDDEMFDESNDQSTNADAAIYGRVTYQMMESYWPTVPGNPESAPYDLRHAQWVNQVRKLVISHTLDKAEWNNSQLIKENVADEMAKLKAQPGGDMMIFGSPRTVHFLAQQGLIDEYQLYVSPVVLGEGIPMFKGFKSQLKLINAKTYDVGVVSLHYATVR